MRGQETFEGTCVDTPAFDDGKASSQWLEVTDPSHALYGKRFAIARIARGPEASAVVFVRYGDHFQLRVPIRATSLSTLLEQAPRFKLTRCSVEDLLSLVKEYESCQQRPKRSGRHSPVKRKKKCRKK